MGCRAQAAEEADERGVGAGGADDPDVRAGKPGRRPQPRPPGVDAGEAFRHARDIFPNFLQWLKEIRDPRRRPDRATFPIDYLLLMGVVMFVGQCGSRRQLGRDLGCGRLPANLWKMVGKAGRHLRCHTDTLNNAMEALDPEELEKLIARMVGRIRERKMLRRFMFDGKLVVAVDGVQVMRVNSPVGDGWLTAEKDGKVTYSRYVLASYIVTSAGLVVPFAFEFVENPTGPFEKQDCELKASRRLLAKIRRLYPRLEIMVAGDALFAEEGTFRQCEELGFGFMITCKEKKLPTVDRQLPGADGKWTGERRVRAILRGRQEKGEHHVRWQTPVTYHGQTLHVVELTERDADGNTLYYNKWICNIKPQWHNALALALAGRLRWKIENEGFNTEKNGGYEMEHGYGQRGHAWKNYCLLLQIGKLFNDLARLGNITQVIADDIRSTFARLYGTMRHYARCLIASLANAILDDAPPTKGRAWQYRLAPD